MDTGTDGIMKGAGVQPDPEARRLIHELAEVYDWMDPEELDDMEREVARDRRRKEGEREPGEA